MAGCEFADAAKEDSCSNQKLFDFSDILKKIDEFFRLN